MMMKTGSVRVTRRSIVGFSLGAILGFGGSDYSISIRRKLREYYQPGFGFRVPGGVVPLHLI